MQRFEKCGSVEVRGERFVRREGRAAAFPAKGAKVGKSARDRGQALRI
jgi:hypothetical protein